MADRVVFHRGALAALLDGPQGVVAKDLARRAIRVEAAAKRLAPVDTGRLRSSITWRIEHRAGIGGGSLVAIVGTDVHYAPYQEFGTSRMPAHPFLRPALLAAMR